MYVTDNAMFHVTNLHWIDTEEAKTLQYKEKADIQISE